MTKSKLMTLKDASRIYSATANTGSGTVPKGSFGARAMSAATRQSGPSVTPAAPKSTKLK